MMLILPGFFTDILGLICLLPWTRPTARRAIGLVVASHCCQQRIRHHLGALALRERDGRPG